MDFVSDLKQSVRALRKSPGFAATAIAALALGIGANTAIFSVVDRVLLKPLPYADSDRLVQVSRKFKTGYGDSTSIPKFVAWRQETKAFEAMTAFDFGGPGLNLSGGDVPENVKGIHATYEYFRVFGVKPQFGRTYTAEEDRPGGPRVIVISDGLWKRRFGADRSVIARAVALNGDSYTVIGVLPPKFDPMPASDIWMPLQADPASTNQGHYLNTVGRLKPGATVEQANAQLKVVGERFRAANPDWMGKEESVAARSLQETIVGDVRTALLVLVGAVGFVLLIACANVANLLLARATGRQREIAIRSAIGAGRARIIRQLLTESVVLSLLGGALGLLLGCVGVRALLVSSPGNVPRVEMLAGDSMNWFAALDWRIVAFTGAVSLITGVLFGLVPAIQVSRVDLNTTLKEASGRAGSGMRQNRMRNALVILETAMALVLLAGSALLIRTFVGLRTTDLGIDTSHILTFQVSVAGSKYHDARAADNFERQATERLDAIPGVSGSTLAIMLPTSEGGVDLPFTISGKPLAPGEKYHGDVFWRNVSVDYFNIFKIRTLRGRVFDRRDLRPSPAVVVINEALAKKYFKDEDPIGRQILIGKDLGPDFEDATRQIVGIVSGVREVGAQGEMPPVMYIPNQQVPVGMWRLGAQVVPMSFAVRTAGDPFSIAEAARREILAVDGQMAVSGVKSMEQLVSKDTARQNFNMLLLTLFAGIALLLAAIGLYGLMAYSVEQRKQEIGIRLALGAGKRDVVGMVVRQGMTLAGLGLAVGLAAAFGLARLIASLLYNVKPYDPLTFAGVTVVLAVVAFLASYIPARRALRVDPVIALRYE